jgi:hypothetical protein
VTIAQVEASPVGVKGFLDDLQESLRTKRYRIFCAWACSC